MEWDDVQPKKASGTVIGESLENMSVDELKQRITELNREIERVTKEHDRKLQIGAAADRVFKS